MRIFALITLLAVSMPIFAVSHLTCISENNSFTRCPLPNAEHRQVDIHQSITGNCNANGAWGVDSQGIWVRQNCGATFRYYNDTSYTGPIEPYIYGYNYGPNYHYPDTAVFFGSGYYHDDYYGGYTRNGNYYHSGTYQRHHGNGNYSKP